MGHEADPLLADVREITAAVERREISRAKQLLRASGWVERLEAGALPEASIGAEVHAMLEGVLVLALAAEDARRATAEEEARGATFELFV